MPTKPSPRLASKPARATAKSTKAKSTKAQSAKPKSAKLTSAKTKAVKPKPVRAEPEEAAQDKATPRPRAKVLKELPPNIRVDQSDAVAMAALAEAAEKSATGVRVGNRRSAVDRLNDPPPEQDTSAALLARVSTAIERELSRIEILVGDGRARPAGAESRARVLASLARTLKEVMHLREQQAGAEDERAKAADDDMPRDIDAFRHELARRLEILVGEAKTLHPDEPDPP
jgi:hypothetical protein